MPRDEEWMFACSWCARVLVTREGHSCRTCHRDGCETCVADHHCDPHDIEAHEKRVRERPDLYAPLKPREK